MPPSWATVTPMLAIVAAVLGALLSVFKPGCAWAPAASP
jgi:hypothetical protein